MSCFYEFMEAFVGFQPYKNCIIFQVISSITTAKKHHKAMPKDFLKLYKESWTSYIPVLCHSLYSSLPRISSVNNFLKYYNPTCTEDQLTMSN